MSHIQFILYYKVFLYNKFNLIKYKISLERTLMNTK